MMEPAGKRGLSKEWNRKERGIATLISERNTRRKLNALLVRERLPGCSAKRRLELLLYIPQKKVTTHLNSRIA